MQVVVLASGSQYRAQMLSRLGIDFQTVSPEVDESALLAEPPATLAQRLAKRKAQTVAGILKGRKLDVTSASQDSRCHIIIASDQVASTGSSILGKPGTPAKACAQLAEMSGQSIDFFTSLYMLDTQSGSDFCALDTTRVAVRHLDAASIERYIAADKPLDCAGSFKLEALGISLFESVSSEDPTALIGLPMIKVCEGLRFFGLQIP